MLEFVSGTNLEMPDHIIASVYFGLSFELLYLEVLRLFAEKVVAEDLFAREF